LKENNQVAIKATLPFQMQIEADGSSTSLTVAFATAPFMNTESGGELIGLNLGSVAPSGLDNLALSGSTIEVTAAIGVLGTTVTFTFSSAPAAGVWYITGRLQF
jgi:hypothetical protein